MKADYTHLSVLLDRSGSMAGIKTDMEGGFNNFIAEQRKVPGVMTVTLAQFDEIYELVYNSIPVAVVHPLHLHPRGGTALLDSIAKLIFDTGKELAALNEEDRPANVIFQIITDGEENCSHEQTPANIAAMIKEQEEKYNWHFIYLGANQDAFTVAGGIGVKCGVNYRDNARGIAAMFSAVSSNTMSNRTRANDAAYTTVTQEEVDTEENK